MIYGKQTLITWNCIPIRSLGFRSSPRRPYPTVSDQVAEQRNGKQRNQIFKMTLRGRGCSHPALLEGGVVAGVIFFCLAELFEGGELEQALQLRQQTEILRGSSNGNVIIAGSYYKELCGIEDVYCGCFGLDGVRYPNPL